jgi:hypothetical protein
MAIYYRISPGASSSLVKGTSSPEVRPGPLEWPIRGFRGRYRAEGTRPDRHCASRATSDAVRVGTKRYHKAASDLEYSGVGERVPSTGLTLPLNQLERTKVRKLPRLAAPTQDSGDLDVGAVDHMSLVRL